MPSQVWRRRERRVVEKRGRGGVMVVEEGEEGVKPEDGDKHSRDIVTAVTCYYP